MYLGLDIGGSATRWYRIPRASPHASGQANGFSGHLFRPDVRAAAQASLATIRGECGPADVIVAGVTGISRGSPEARALADLLRETFGASRVVLLSDIELAYRAAFQPGQGILVYAGTGSIAAHLTGDGNLLTAGGKGVLIDDAGGGYWIAIQALRHILRTEDTIPGSGWSTVLGRELASSLGGSDWPTVRQAVYGTDRGGIGMLALPVARAAAAGDGIASDIMRHAGQELGQLAAMLEQRCGEHPISIAGRAAALDPGILEGFRHVLPGRFITHNPANAAETAARLAADPQFLQASGQTGD